MALDATLKIRISKRTLKRWQKRAKGDERSLSSWIRMHLNMAIAEDTTPRDKNDRPKEKNL